MSNSRKWAPDKVADAVAEAIGLADDLVVSEIRTAENRTQAIRRLKDILADVNIALDVVIRGRSDRERPGMLKEGE